MLCPACSNEETKVVDSRDSQEGTAIRRRRECEKCEFRFSTLEELELLDLSVVKRDGRTEMYDREKVLAGLRKALEKRPVSEHDIRTLIGTIERLIQKRYPREIKSSAVGEIIMECLKRFDKVAYIRFASVYRQFEDVATFEKELRMLRKKKGKGR